MKKLALLSLLLSSTSCFAMPFVGFGGPELIFIVGIPLALLFIATLLLHLCFCRLILKNKEIRLTTLFAASFFSIVLLGGIYVLLFQFLEPLYAKLFGFGSLFFFPSCIMATILLMIALSMPLYRWLFPTIEKRNRLFMILFIFSLNPLQWLLSTAAADYTKRKLDRPMRIERERIRENIRRASEQKRSMESE